MSTPVVYNGVTYNVPAFGDVGYAQNAGNMSAYWIALATGSLQQTGGAFTLTADVNWGPNFGLLSKYFTSITPTPATAGIVRLAKTDSVDWRNNANSANLALGINGSDQLTFNGTPITGAAVTSIIGTTDEINVSSPTGVVTLSTPQPIASTSSPTFAGLTLSTTPLPVASGGSGTSSPSLVAGSNVTITGSWPNQTINAATGGSSTFQSGDIKMAAYSSTPSGWLLCDGTSYLRASFPTLFSAIGTAYGSADGTHFNVPNMVDNVGVGVGGSITPTLGSTAGASTVTPVQNAHTHTQNSHQHVTAIGARSNGTALFTPRDGAWAGGETAQGSINNTVSAASNGTESLSLFNTTLTTATNQNTIATNLASSVVQPSLGVNYFIKI